MEGMYVGWDEVYVCGERGRREIHYCLKRKDGGSDLAVIAKEKSLRHFSYRFMPGLAPLNSSSSSFKLRSRREVVDWLHSFLPDSPTPVSPQTSGASVDGTDVDEIDVDMMRDTQLRKLGHYTKEFLWVGSPWTCKKRRKHYKAFRRNGVKISVNEFVFVLAEEDKRLVAYLDDMYEDSKGNKMVVVRWFHKVDEVDIDLPHDFNDREIFFSLCLQDLSIECIDGLATVLSPQHYAKFLKEAKHTQLEPFVCHLQYDNEDLKPLDITQVKGYWEQEVLRYILSLSSSRSSEKSCLADGSMKKGDASCPSEMKPRKRLRLSKDCKVDLQCAIVDNAVDVTVMNGQGYSICLNQKRSDDVKSSCLPQGAIASVSTKDLNMEVSQFIAVGSLVEVLSQDSGMRGCWLRAVIIKKHKNKVKLRYNDIRDAENEANCLEEWVLASRIASSDVKGLRMYGRSTIRPALLTHNGKVSWVINVGTVVDVWWHDGWWEGIVIQKESDEKLRVYFPGEKREAVFLQSDLRHSQEWMGNTWKELSERPDIAAAILSDLVKEGLPAKAINDKQPRTVVAAVCSNKQLDHYLGKENIPCLAQDCSGDLRTDTASKKTQCSSMFDFIQLKWDPSLKRKRSALGAQKRSPRCNNRVKSGRLRRIHEDYEEDFVIPSTLKIEKESCKATKVDRDNCKYISDSLFVSSVVPPLTSLVMSR